MGIQICQPLSTPKLKHPVILIFLFIIIFFNDAAVFMKINKEILSTLLICWLSISVYETWSFLKIIPITLYTDM